MAANLREGNSARQAFPGRASLTDLTILDSATRIGQLTFVQCMSRASVTLGNSVTSTGAVAFGWCTNLIAGFGDREAGERLRLKFRVAAQGGR